MPPKFLYFDLGNVLLYFSNEKMQRQAAEVVGVSVDVVTQAVCPAGDQTDPQWRFESGLLGEDEFYGHLCQQLGAAPDRAKLEHAASDIFAPIQATHDLADRLAQAGYRLGLLSNTNIWHWRFVLDGRYPTLNRAFGVRVTSFDARAMKPDPRIYELAIAKAEVAAGEIFFTDDREENVAGAIEAGIDAVLFTSTEQLIEDLRSRGVETG